MTNSTAAQRAGVSSWKHLIDVPLNFTFEYEKKVVEGRVLLITTVKFGFIKRVDKGGITAAKDLES